MKKIDRKNARWIVLMASGVVFAVLAMVLILKAIMDSGDLFSIAILLVLGVGIGGYGLYKWKMRDR